jgi:EAL domain-containing protein (putative c-di-GMP-specific phosphodiesterase class I)
MNKKRVLLFSLFILYALSVYVSSVLIYQNTKATLLTQLDQELKSSPTHIAKEPNSSGQFIVFEENINESVQNSLLKIELLKNTRSDEHNKLIKTINDVFINNNEQFINLNMNQEQFRFVVSPNINSGSIHEKSVSVRFKSTEFIYELVHENLRYMLSFSILILLVLSPLIISYKNKYKAEWKNKIRNSNKDPITGIPNQQQLLIDIEKSTNPNLAFIKIMNYNGFINQYGPAVTDNIVKQFSTVLSSFEDPRLVKDSIYRVQQSTFAILEDQDICLEDISDITGKIVKSLVTYNYMIGENEFIKLNLTVGSVRQKKDAFTLANMALSEAIEKQIPYFLIDKGEKFLPETYKRDLELVKQLHLAFLENRLIPFFQPIFDAKSLEVVKYESLARIVDENNIPMIPPNVFIALANREKLNYKITRIILNESIKFALRNNVVVSVNLSITDINNEKTREFIYASIKNSGASYLLQFELLENEAIVDSEMLLQFIKKIQKLGSKIGMDDLGKGYSNIERLMNLPIDFVKLDRSIMEHITDNLEIQNLTKGIIKLAHKKNLSVTAEFCSNKVITDMAILLGADYLQGFYFSEASPDVYMLPEKLNFQVN